MLKYLQYLQGDIANSREQAKAVFKGTFLPDVSNTADSCFVKTKRLPLEELLGIPANTFPPVHFLQQKEVSLLIEHITQLWHSWQLRWQLPPSLTEHQTYQALVHAMLNESINWSPIQGGEVSICNVEGDRFCPYGENATYCHCRKVAEAAEQEFAVWEEHVRSQGIDPYLYLSPEEEAAFFEGIRKKGQRK